MLRSRHDDEASNVIDDVRLCIARSMRMQVAKLEGDLVVPGSWLLTRYGTVSCTYLPTIRSL
jgi:hypothetical protein